jgi:phosphoribosylformylglycinamidine synthase subunit PurL
MNEQTIKDHGLNSEEYDRICDSLGREPNLVELGVFSVMWSEHCSYKSSRVHLTTLPTEGKQVICGPGENAGVVDIGDGWCVIFKIESHNHPSFIEPYQGAGTGVGGIMRDIFTMGARPVALLNSLRFGDLKLAKTKSLVHGVVAGIAGYGNCMGVPCVGGECTFDASFNGNNLVNAFCAGVARTDKVFYAQAKGIGNPVLYLGAKTGRDGIHGATMASSSFGGNAAPSASGGRGPHSSEPLSREPAKPDSLSQEEELASKKPTVQVGDPFTEKRLLEACLELMQGGDIVAIQDMGAAGLTCSSVEMASSGGVGLELNLDQVPCRETEMSAYEMMLSESQERMLLVARQGSEKRVQAIFDKWDLDAAVVGRIVEGDSVHVQHHGEQVATLPVNPIAKEAPLYRRPSQVPKELKALQTFDIEKVPLQKDWTKVFANLLSRPNVASKKWIYRQYDHMVGTDTVVLPGSDAAVLRLKGTGVQGKPDKGLAVAVDCNSRYCRLDPYEGGKHAVAEAARNIACSGARPLAASDCLNFGSPENPEIMWQFEQAIKGIGEACLALNTPIVSGNVSFYNETMGEAIDPCPTISMVGLLPNIEKHCTQWFKQEGDLIFVVGAGRPSLGASEYLDQIIGKKLGRPAKLNLTDEMNLQSFLYKAIQKSCLHSAHDISKGGIAIALAESALSHEGHAIGASIQVPGKSRDDVRLFGESGSRALISIDAAKKEALEEIAATLDCPLRFLGKVGGDRIVIDDDIDIELSGAYDMWWNGFERALRS